jgi:hypothetical protein
LVFQRHDHECLPRSIAFASNHQQYFCGAAPLLASGPWPTQQGIHNLLPALGLRNRGGIAPPALYIAGYTLQWSVLGEELSALAIEPLYGQCSTDLATVPLMTLSVRGFTARRAAFPLPLRGAVVYNGAFSLDCLILLPSRSFLFSHQSFSLISHAYGSPPKTYPLAIKGTVIHRMESISAFWILTGGGIPNSLVKLFLPP